MRLASGTPYACWYWRQGVNLLPTQAPHGNMGVVAHALSRVICWSVLHAVAGGDLAKQHSNPWGHGECLFFHFKIVLGARRDHFDPFN